MRIDETLCLGQFRCSAEYLLAKLGYARMPYIGSQVVALPAVVRVIAGKLCQGLCFG